MRTPDLTGTRLLSTPPPVLLMSGVRAAYGLLLLAAPRPVITAVAGRVPSAADCAVARVLGGRHLAQAVLSAAIGCPALGAGVVVDGLHAASMFGLGGARPALRRAELADATVASLLAGAGAAQALSIRRKVTS